MQDPHEPIADGGFHAKPVINNGIVYAYEYLNGELENVRMLWVL